MRVACTRGSAGHAVSRCRASRYLCHTHKGLGLIARRQTSWPQPVAVLPHAALESILVQQQRAPGSNVPWDVRRSASARVCLCVVVKRWRSRGGSQGKTSNSVEARERGGAWRTGVLLGSCQPGCRTSDWLLAVLSDQLATLKAASPPGDSRTLQRRIWPLLKQCFDSTGRRAWQHCLASNSHCVCTLWM